MSFSDCTIQNVWEKGIVDPSYNSNIWRKDKYGTWIGRAFYGNRDSEYGWEIDHIRPVAEGGTDDIFNLQPLHWQNNVAKQ